jgi:hypothetical protein
MTTLKKLLLCLAALPLLAAASRPADAHGHVFVGLNFGFPAYAYYPPPPVYYAPAPAYYYPPPPVYYTPAPVAAPAPAPSCRTFHGDASVDDNGSPFYGTACLQSDGRWHIVGQ